MSMLVRPGADRLRPPDVRAVRRPSGSRAARRSSAPPRSPSTAAWGSPCSMTGRPSCAVSATSAWWRSRWPMASSRSTPTATSASAAVTAGACRTSSRSAAGWTSRPTSSKFNAMAYGDACLDFVDWCRGMRALVSSKGIAVCLRIDLELDTWEPGIGYVWGESFPDLYFDGCDIGDYKEHIGHKGVASIAAAGEQVVRVAPDLPGTVFAAEGRRRPAADHAGRPRRTADRDARGPRARRGRGLPADQGPTRQDDADRGGRSRRRPLARHRRGRHPHLAAHRRGAPGA